VLHPEGEAQALNGIHPLLQNPSVEDFREPDSGGIVLQEDDLILFERPFSGCFQSPEQDIRIFIKLLICQHFVLPDVSGQAL
jgi:hypothetical protein